MEATFDVFADRLVDKFWQLQGQAIPSAVLTPPQPKL